MQIQIEEFKDQIAFSNSEIVLMDAYTIDYAHYDKEKKETRFYLKIKEEKTDGS